MSLCALLGLVAVACDSGDGRTLDPPTAPLPPPPVPATSLPPEPTAPLLASLRMVAPWQDGAPIPVRHTCDGENLAPALTWTDVPAGTVELAVTVTDLDAAGTVHWILYAIPPDRASILEDEVPPGAFQWANSSGNAGYDGPCPPIGEEHRYQFTVHALNQQLEAADDAPATEVISILNLIVIDQSSVSGTFARAG